eukprot:TRINITY_DN8207_c2_g1_i1.p2 TRINITY_DN8207_c2_g1~~TRINITY_DN8207_c2_g1_i1.p2  ORF type:complete len:300 (+),score=84.60 TRINITY_DN8207_c2_g1_i1:288-1187(+)
MSKKGKLSKKEQLRLARLEAQEETKRIERESAAREEYTARSYVSLLEQLGWSELNRARLEQYANPSCRLSIPLRRHRMEEGKWEDRVRMLQRDLEESQELLEHTTKAKESLEEELREVRSYRRNERDVLNSKMQSLERKVCQRLEEVIARTMTDIEEERMKAQELWNVDIEKTRMSFVRLLHEVKTKAWQLTYQLQEAKALHSNLPIRIRRHLADLDKHDLLMMVDTLSFEPEVLQFFMFRYPPEPDMPYGKLDFDKDAAQTAETSRGGEWALPTILGPLDSGPQRPPGWGVDRPMTAP